MVLSPFVLFIGLLMLGIWDTTGFLFLEVLILYEQWAGHRLLSDKVNRPHVRALRRISLSSVPVSEGIEIRQVGLFQQKTETCPGKIAGSPW